MTEIQLFLWIGLAAFLVLILGIGIYSGKKTKSVRDFAIGGGQLGPVVLGLSFTGTYLSAAAFLGYAGCPTNTGIPTSGFFWRSWVADRSAC